MTTIIQYSPQLIGEILDIVHNAVFLLDPGNRILFANTRMEAMFKAKEGKLSGLDFAQLFMPEDRMILVPNILKITKEEKEFECETMLRCLDGSTFLGLVACVFYLWEGKGLVAITVHDITKMKNIERMLKHTEHETFQGCMLDDISHHIRNPVLVMGGLAKRLCREESTQKYAEIMVRESRKLEELLDTLNAFIHLPRPKLKYATLEEVMKAIDQHVKPVTEEFDVQRNWQCSENVLVQTILVDLAMLMEAVKAVVINACESYKNDAPDKTVTLKLIETFEPSWPYALKITDHGRGIPTDDLPHVASHFFTKKSRHIGMGLTFAERILDEQDGELHIDSSPGQGTTVSLFFKKERRRPIRIEKL